MHSVFTNFLIFNVVSTFCLRLYIELCLFFELQATEKRERIYKLFAYQRYVKKFYLFLSSSLLFIFLYSYKSLQSIVFPMNIDQLFEVEFFLAIHQQTTLRFMSYV